MERISCNIVKDLLPLYIDGILSAESAETVSAHLETCESCQQEHEIMTQKLTLPSTPAIQEESRNCFKNFKRQWQIRKIAAVLISMVITAVIIVTGGMIYLNVGSVHDFFSPETVVILRNMQTSEQQSMQASEPQNMQTSEQWKQIQFQKGNYLNFDSIFYSKQATVDANSDGAVDLRICDKKGRIVINHRTIQPGKSASLGELERDTDYVVEIKTDADFIRITFD